jgi:hypothetical protein
MSSSLFLRYFKGVRTYFRNKLREEKCKASELITGESEESNLDEKIDSASSFIVKINLYREKRIKSYATNLYFQLEIVKKSIRLWTINWNLCSSAIDIYYVELKYFLSKLHHAKEKSEEQPQKETDTHM